MKFLKPIKKGGGFLFRESAIVAANKKGRRNSRKPEADAPDLFPLLLTAFPRLLVFLPAAAKNAV